jgi:hypothetical protein
MLCETAKMKGDEDKLIALASVVPLKIEEDEAKEKEEQPQEPLARARKSKHMICKKAPMPDMPALNRASRVEGAKVRGKDT